jgi:hypothetical protein
MLVLSNSMPKSGSTLFRNYTNALVALRSGSGGAAALRGLGRTGTLPLIGGFLPKPTGRELDILLRASDPCPIVVKVHARLTQDIRDRIGPRCRVTYCIRDPRDVLVSARDHARRSQEVGDPMFGAFLSDDTGIAALKPMLEMAVDWQRSGLALMVRYDDLVLTPARELRRLADHLGIEASDAEIEAIVAGERATRTPGRNNFNTGELNRFRSALSPEFLTRLEAEFGAQLRALGYPPVGPSVFR